jgi:hypothetical protein
MRNGALLIVVVLAAACGSSSQPLPPVTLGDGAVDLQPDVRTDGTAPDGASACPACAADELCLVKFDGNCQPLGASCVKKTAGCQTPACNDACNRDFCGFPAQPTFSCQSVCPASAQYPGAMFCYGV